MRDRQWEWRGLCFAPPYGWKAPLNLVKPALVWEPWKGTRIVKHPLLYICAPYTPRGEHPTAEVHQNVQRAIGAGEQAMRRGWVPVIPHLYHYAHLQHPRPYEEWMELCMALLERCDSIWVVTPGDITPGMQREIEWAREHGMRIRMTPTP